MSPEKLPYNFREQPKIKSQEQNRKVLIFYGQFYTFVHRRGAGEDITTAFSDEQKSRKIADIILDAAANVAAHGRAPTEPERPYKQPSSREIESMQQASALYEQLLELSKRHGMTEEI